MPRGSHHDVIGIVLQDGRRTILRVEGGGEWHLDSDRSFTRYLGRRVRVQGTRDGFDLLCVQTVILL